MQYCTKTKRNSLNRKGFSLMELLLVMALIVAVAALAAPALSGTLRFQALKESIDLVRADFGKARAESMRTGKEYVFQYSPGTNQYKYGPYEQVSALGATNPTLTVAPVQNFRYGDGTLARGVIFQDSTVQLDSRQMELQDEAGAASTGGVRQILFYPDGSTQTAQLFLQTEQGEIRGVHLRGLTGISSVVDANGVQQ